MPFLYVVVGKVLWRPLSDCSYSFRQPDRVSRVEDPVLNLEVLDLLGEITVGAVGDEEQ